MINFQGLFYVFLTLLLSISQPAVAINSVKEANLAVDIRNSLQTGISIDLQANNGQFLAIYEETSKAEKRGGIVILHDLKQNPDSPGLIRELRTALSASGWDTLAIQLPSPVVPEAMMSSEPLIQQGLARLNAAIAYFTGKEINNIALVGHGLGAGTATGYLENANADDNPVKAAVLISLDASENHILQKLQKIEKTAVLDVFGTRDLPAVIKTAANRKRAIGQTAKNPLFRQIPLEAADHDYTGLEASVIGLVRGWLGKYADGM